MGEEISEQREEDVSRIHVGKELISPRNEEALE